MSDYSFIIPVYNDLRITQCLDSIVSLDFPENRYEVVIILNGCSSPPLIQLLREYEVRNQGLIKLAFLEQRSIASARNIGVRSSRGDYSLFIDSDCQLPKNYLMLLDETIRELGNDNNVLRGKVKFESSNWLNALNSRLRRICYEQTGKDMVFAPNLVVPKKLFEQYGFFDERIDYGVDTEWGQLMSYHGIYPRYFESFEIIHYEDVTFLKTIKTWFKYGVGMAFRMRRDYKLGKKTVKVLAIDFLKSWRGPEFTQGFLFTIFVVLYRVINTAGLVYGLYKTRHYWILKP